MANKREYAVKVRVRSDEPTFHAPCEVPGCDHEEGSTEIQVCYRWATSPEDAADQMRGFQDVLEVLQVGTRGEVTL